MASEHAHDPAAGDADGRPRGGPAAPASDLAWTTRPVRELVRLAGPICVSTLSFSAMTLASTAFVARLGADALAGVGLGAIVAFGLVCFGTGLIRGTKTLVSQAVGAGRRDRIDDFLGAGLGVGLGFGLAAALAATVLGPVVAHLCASSRAGAFAAEYLRIRGWGAPLYLAMNALRETRYGEGDTTSPMRAALAANAVNIVLDAVFILGLGWGVRGAALAAVCGNAMSLALLAWPMRRRLVRLRWRPEAARALWRQGLPAGLQFLMEVGSFLILTAFVSHMSSVDAAAHEMVLHVINVSFLPAFAIAEAGSILVGRAVGADRFDLVRAVAVRAVAIGAAYALTCVGLLAVLGGAIAHGLAGGDAALAAGARGLIHVGMLFMVADAANVIARGILRGAGDVRFAAVVGVATSWLTTPPLTWLLGIHLGLGARGGWIGLAAETTVGAALFWLRLARGGWHGAARATRRDVIEVPPAAALDAADDTDVDPGAAACA